MNSKKCNPDETPSSVSDLLNHVLLVKWTFFFFQILEQV